MRVAIVLDDFYPASGGVARSVETQLEKLVDGGHEVTLIAPDRHLQKPRGCRTIECPTIYIEGTSSHLSVLHFSRRRAQLISDCGDFDVILLVRASDARDLRRIVLEDIQAIPSIRSTRTTLIFEDFSRD